MSQKTQYEIATALKAAAERRMYVEKCRKEFEATPNIYAIEYVYRHHYWSTDRRGHTRPVSFVGEKRVGDPSLVFWKTTPAGAMVAVKTMPWELAFGWSRVAPGDKWNKYIGLHGALLRAAEWTGEYRGRVGAWAKFIARQRDRLVASRNRRLYGNEAGKVSITARGDTRIEVKGSGNQVVITGDGHAVSMTRRTEAKAPPPPEHPGPLMQLAEALWNLRTAKRQAAYITRLFDVK